MVASLGLVLAALRAGLAVRRARAARRPPPRGARERHLRLAKPALVCVGIGLVAGPVSAAWLRGWDVFGTFHAWLGLAAALAFAAAAVAGRRLERGQASAREAHALLAAGGVLAAAVAAIAGFVLLP
jgi:uncharacterized membrane protein YedE/YeeE